MAPKPLIPTYVERTDLPRIIVQSRGGARYSAYVQAYIAGPAEVIKGRRTTALFSLSLEAMRGQGALLRGIWSGLVASHVEEITIDGLGHVALAQHVLSTLRYPLYWNYYQQTMDDGSLHALIESNQLTVCDPVLGMATKERPPRHQKARHQQRKRAQKVDLATLKKKDEQDEEEAKLRNLFPLFLIRTPGSVQPPREQGEEEQAYHQRCQHTLANWRIEQHMAFLTLRYPFPLLPEWAAYIWNRGLSRGEITRLKTWSPQVEQVEAEPFPRILPLWHDAWLCQPAMVSLKTDLDAFHLQRSGRSLIDARPDQDRELVGIS
ncbi:MAG TPA: hypothetical protein VHD63_23120 [Ktedonobacteraceae bacterium]|nr:hypothetical protein [Ktedonobacteraceae bacterium]